MSDKKFEPCTLTEATHVEMGGKMYELDVWESGGACKDYEEGHCVGISVDDKDEILSIPISLFPILGIKPMRERKQEPIEFETTFVKHDNHWHPLYSLDYGFPCQNYKTARFKCVEILEEKK
jgi:hypothetical protein